MDGLNVFKKNCPAVARQLWWCDQSKQVELILIHKSPKYTQNTSSLRDLLFSVSTTVSLSVKIIICQIRFVQQHIH